MSYALFTTDVSTSIRISVYNSIVNLEYSFDGQVWQALDFSSKKYRFVSVENVLYIRGSGNENLTGSIFSYRADYGNHYWSGNLEALIDYTKVDNGEHPVMGEQCFATFAKGDTKLISVQNLQFPSVGLARGCFAQMFNGCTSLVNAPTLPATTLAESCCFEMFRGCTSLVNAPLLPATTLGKYCYREMFFGCTSLVNAPSLPATILNEYCYQEMFSGCTSLVNVTLPATTLARSCYQQMFQGCTSLVSAPSLPATTLAEFCYGQMFSGCSNLVNVTLPATTLAYYCYNNMFRECTSLVNAPTLPITTLAEGCYNDMFFGCTSLVNAPVLPATTLAGSCYSGMFFECTSLVNAPVLPATTLTENCYNQMFRGCTSLVNAPVLPATILDRQCYYGMFYGCTGLVNAPSLPVTILTEGCYKSMFQGCTSLINAPIMSIATIPAKQCYMQMFMDCTNLTIIPNSLFTSEVTLSYNECCRGMFQGCTSLTVVPTLPAKLNTVYQYVYAEMFKNCTNLVSAPELPSINVGPYAYQDMFYGCTSLVNPPSVLPATSLNSYCYRRMFYGCTSLVNASFNILMAQAGSTETGTLYICSGMFQGCVNLEIPPEMPNVRTIGNYGCSSMFSGCSKLKKAPQLVATNLGKYAYSYMFSGCTSLAELPSLPCTSLKNYAYQYMFSGCSNIKISDTRTQEYNTPYKIPSGDATGTATKYSLVSMFANTGGPFTGTPAINTTYYVIGEAPSSTIPIYVGVNGKARQVTDMYVGVNGKAREVTAIYVGVNGKARKVFPIDPSSYATVTIKGGKEDEIKIFDGVTLLKTVTFETDKISKKVKLPTNKLLTFTSTKFKYGDDNTYFSKNATIVEDCIIKVMPEGALYWYGNECSDVTGGWAACPVVYAPLSESTFSGLTPRIVKNDHSIWCGWNSTDLGSVDTNYYYSGGLTTNNKIQIASGDVGKVHLIKSLYKKESQTNNTVCGGSLITPALSGKVGGYGNDDIIVEYPQSGYTTTPGQTLLKDTIITFPPQSSQIGNQYYLGWGMSVSKHNGELLYSYVEFDYYVMG